MTAWLGNISFFWLQGTLGYVMSEVEGGRPFSQVVTSAKKLGFTEPGNEIGLSFFSIIYKSLPFHSRLLQIILWHILGNSC